jgi:arylsulfatase
VPTPGEVDGNSLAPFVTDASAAPDWPEYVHGEHAISYDPEEAMQFITDGREKYIWFTVTGREQLFDLANDPYETKDLTNDPSAKDRLELWRQRMVDTLAPRTQDGLVKDGKLVSGIQLPAVRPELLEYT